LEENNFKEIEAVRAVITECNRRKALLMANKDKYEPEYYYDKIHELDSYIKAKQSELLRLQNSRLTKQIIGLSVLAVIICLGFIFGKPVFTGLVTLDNASYVNEEMMLDNITETEEADYANEEAPVDENEPEPDISDTIIDAPEPEKELSEPEEEPSEPYINEETVPYVNEEIGLNVSYNETNLTVRVENVTEDNISLNISLNISENISVANMTVPVNVTVENVSLEANITNLPPNGSIPDQFMETNMALSLDLDDYFSDPEDDRMYYHVETEPNFEVSFEGSVLSLISGNSTGNFTLPVNVSDGLSYLISELRIEVISFAEMVSGGLNLSRNLSLNLSLNLSRNMSLNFTRFNLSLVRNLFASRFLINVHRLELIGDKYAFMFEKRHNYVLLNALRNISEIQNITVNERIESVLIDNKNATLGTDIVAMNPVNISNATVALEKHGAVNTIVKCAYYDFINDTCSDWEMTGIPFVDNGTHISFVVDSFSGYGGAYITIIDLQSYPTVGGNWTVRFNTTGVANLTISASNGTTYGNATPDDLQWLELRCGNDSINASFNGTHVFYQNWNCSSLGYQTVKVLTPGKHTQKFEFGTDVGYANNWAKSGNVYNCSTCTDCNNAIADASAGDIIQMNQSQDH